MSLKKCLPPIADNHAETLILGSLPGDESLARGQYYAHPRNHFWRIIAAVLEETLPEIYVERADMLRRRRVALWDVLCAARRQGSLDGSIKDAEPNDLPGFLADHPNISFVLLNGGTASRYYAKFFPSLYIPHATVRSSSPVPAREANSLDEKIALWSRAWRERM